MTLGLLLDVDGPLASTVTRTLRVPSIAPDLVALAHAGAPVVFNTGRSHAFLVERVIPALADAGLRADAPVWGVGEKGATWFALDASAETPRAGQVHADEALRPPQELLDAVRAIAVRERDLMFWDDTKRTMISVEQNVDTANADYLAAQPAFVAACQAVIDELGLAADFHIVPTIISVDIEHVTAGKALGAERALGLIEERMAAPRRWFTAGDSPSDYDMAAWLHARGDDVVHLDVRPAGGVPAVGFEVIRDIPTAERAEDDLTAAHLTRLRGDLGA
ncbi:hypothetical protein GCM10017576_03490 [Microbacterium barkeri]|uniref:Hydroxymethylpyrimidine pyrophosphatase-like HAD family hydrolase n=1 Tax=Microbacterium barkeri TaxID=33917 RepID=A0A9W6LVI5_9MICO|nr:hypothetical protein [Microbacterium barkeri]MDR6876103.1 hypothetical protein [Microbacterium barkeri]GLJ60220.1 hypothetical protein GCM10017576_03490 [Microbacterium barkeri]